MLGLMDDIIGVTEAGFRAQQMNALINVNSADKGLQFRPTKCKSMLIGKETEYVLNSDLLVDSWIVKHELNLETGEAELIENYGGPIPIEKVKEQKYLGFIISSSGNNMANINELKKKSIGVLQKIFNKLNSLTLQKYYFECGIIFMNVMLRSSLLYACETYYNLKENELRQIERIEEGFMRKLLKITAGCPIVQLYLELGQFPARFEIMKTRLLFLKCILSETEESMINRFVKLQLQHMTKGDLLRRSETSEHF